MKYTIVIKAKREDLVGDFDFNGDIEPNDEVRFQKREFLVKKRRLTIVNGKVDSIELLCSELIF